MGYLIVRFIVDMIITAALLWLLIMSSRRSHPQQARHPLQMLLPSLVALLLLIQVLTQSGPKAVDLIRPGAQGAPAATIEVESTSWPLGRLRATDDSQYYFNPFKLHPESGERYTLTYMPLSRYVVKINPADTATPLTADKTGRETDPELETGQTSDKGER